MFMAMEVNMVRPRWGRIVYRTNSVYKHIITSGSERQKYNGNR